MVLIRVATDGQVVIEDLVRGCTVCIRPFVRTLEWFGRTIVHSLNVTYGLNGKIVYSAAQAAAPNYPLVRYTATGDMGSSASLKVRSYRDQLGPKRLANIAVLSQFGNYRLYTTDLTPATAYVGDFTQTRIS